MENIKVRYGLHDDYWEQAWKDNDSCYVVSPWYYLWKELREKVQNQTRVELQFTIRKAMALNLCK